MSCQPRGSFSTIGRSVPRVDSVAKVTGKYPYTADIRVPAPLSANFCAVLPHASAWFVGFQPPGSRSRRRRQTAVRAGFLASCVPCADGIVPAIVGGSSPASSKRTIYPSSSSRLDLRPGEWRPCWPIKSTCSPAAERRRLVASSRLFRRGDLRDARPHVGFFIYAVPSIKDVAQLRGKKMAVTRFGGTMDFAARHFLKGQGFEPGKDVVVIQIGSSADIVPAMANGLVESGVMSVPYMFVARRLGLRELADLSQTGVRYAQAALVAKRSFLKDKRDIVGQFIRAMVEATHYLKSRPAEGMRILGRYTRTEDADILKQAYDYHVHKLLSPVPEIRPDDIKLLLEEAALTHAKAKGANPQDFIDEGPVKEVVRSGLVDQLYRN